MNRKIHKVSCGPPVIADGEPKKMDYLQFVHRVIQDQKGHPPDILNVQNCNRDLTYKCLWRRSSKCKMESPGRLPTLRNF